MNAEEKLVHLIETEVHVEQVKINNFSINYARAGKGKPLLLIHGGNIGWGAWYPNIAFFAQHREVFAVDLPGSGQSTKKTFSELDLEKDFVETLVGFIRHHHLEGTDVIGHSLGGWIALKLALKGLIGKVVLESSLGFTNYIPWKHRLIAFRTIAQLLARTAMKPTKENMRKFLADVLNNRTCLREEFVEYFHESVTREQITHPFLLLNRLFDKFKIKKELMLIDAVESLKNPLLIIAGDRDPLIPFTRLQRSLRHLPSVRLERFQGTGHVPSLEKSAHFNAIASNFLLKTTAP